MIEIYGRRMRLLLAVLITSSGVQCPAVRRDIHGESTKPKEPVEVAAEAVVVEGVGGRRGPVLEAALRAMVTRGFKMTLTDGSTGVITGEIVRNDDARMLMEANERRQFLDPFAEPVDSLDEIEPGMIRRLWRRRLTLSVAVGPSTAVATPRLELCVEPTPRTPAGCTSYPALQAAEVEDVRTTVDAIRATIEAERQPSKSVPATSTEM